MLIDKDHPMIQGILNRINKVERRIEDLIVSKVAWEWMTQKEVVQTLNMSPEYLSKIRRTGQLPCFKIGNKFFFKRKDLEGFLESKRQEAFAVK